jgi:spore photoproduct lyase
MIPRFERLIIDRRALGDPLTERIRSRMAGVEEIVTGDLSGHLRSAGGSGDLLLRYHEGRFVKDFPPTPGAPHCGEKYIATLQGCIFGCTYCYLRSYLSHRSVAILVNSAAMHGEIAEVLASGALRLTTGELGDSLALDRITDLTASILPLLEGTGAVLEVRTKSSSVDHLPGVAITGGKTADLARRHLMVTWTLAPPEAIETEEPLTASLDERLEAISRISRAGLPFAIRLDPIIPHYWNKHSYRNLLERVMESAAGTGPQRIELGILRFPPGLIETVRKQSPHSAVLRGEFVRNRDGKMRLYRPLRISIYREIAGLAVELFPGSALELSMEDRTVWEDAGIEPPPEC